MNITSHLPIVRPPMLLLSMDNGSRKCGNIGLIGIIGLTELNLALDEEYKKTI
jgi:hypothetical protein